ncbi:unnamed protein product, partial [marine sediment metagenome]
IPFAELRDKYQPKAKVIRQLGNVIDTIHPEVTKNVLCSSKKVFHNLPEGTHKILYRQEFNTDYYFNNLYMPGKTVRNFMHCCPSVKESYEPFMAVKELLKDKFMFFMHGMLGHNGIVPHHINQSILENTMFLWHVKPWGDGFGYNMHYAAAMGIPIITRYSDYKDELAGEFLIPGETCIDIENKSPEVIAAEILFWEKRYEQMSESIYKAWEKVCNYDKDFERIKVFLENLK